MTAGGAFVVAVVFMVAGRPAGRPAGQGWLWICAGAAVLFFPVLHAHVMVGAIRSFIRFVTRRS